MARWSLDLVSIDGESCEDADEARRATKAGVFGAIELPAGRLRKSDTICARLGCSARASSLLAAKLESEPVFLFCAQGARCKVGERTSHKYLDTQNRRARYLGSRP